MKSVAVIVRNVAFALIVFATLTSIVSFTIKDRWPLLAALFYATPWLLRLVASCLALALAPRSRSVQIMAVFCITVAGMQASQSYRSDGLVALGNQKTLQISFWNGARSFNREPEHWSVNGDADIVAMVETGRFSPREWELFQSLKPASEWRRLNNSMLLGVRGRIISEENLGVKDRFRCYRLLVSLPEHGEFHVIVVDIRSTAWINREPSLRKILTAAQNDPRSIILGDFNTPSESHWLDDWRKNGLALANDGSRRGFRETWPFGVPLLTLDQIWIGNGWKSLVADVSRPAHDHSRVEVILAPRAAR